MPVIQGTSAVTAAAPVANAIAGSIYEYAPFNAMVTYALVGDAAGALRVSVSHGARVIMQESPISRANRFPVIPDDVNIRRAVVRRGERIVVAARDTAAGPDTLFFNIELLPL